MAMSREEQIAHDVLERLRHDLIAELRFVLKREQKPVPPKPRYEVSEFDPHNTPVWDGSAVSFMTTAEVVARLNEQEEKLRARVYFYNLPKGGEFR